MIKKAVEEASDIGFYYVIVAMIMLGFIKFADYYEEVYYATQNNMNCAEVNCKTIGFYFDYMVWILNNTISYLLHSIFG